MNVIKRFELGAGIRLLITFGISVFFLLYALADWEVERILILLLINFYSLWAVSHFLFQQSYAFEFVSSFRVAFIIETIVFTAFTRILLQMTGNSWPIRYFFSSDSIISSLQFGLVMSLFPSALGSSGCYFTDKYNITEPFLKKLVVVMAISFILLTIYTVSKMR